MSSFKTRIPDTWIVAAYNQVRNYLSAGDHLPLPYIGPEEYGAVALFGGVGDFSKEDEDRVRASLVSLADKVSVAIFKVTHGSLKANETSVKSDTSLEITMDTYGFKGLLQEYGLI